MQELDQLKLDIQELIDTAGATITALVEHAQAKVTETVQAVAPQVAFDVAPHLIELSGNVRTAIDRIKQQAAVVLGIPAVAVMATTIKVPPDAPVVSVPPPNPPSAGVVVPASSGADMVAQAAAAAVAEVTDPQNPGNAPAAAPAPSSDALPPVDFGAKSIGPDSFKSGA